MIGIYKITNPNGRIYIGQSIDLKYRFDTYRRLGKQVSSSPKLYRSLLKYGYSKHKIEIIEQCTIENLNTRERFWQDFYNANSAENLNCILTKTNSKSGVGQKISEKQKQQISKAHKGKKLSEETINKIKLARSKQIITKEHKENISKNSGSARIILDINTGVFYNSAKELSNLYGFKHNSLICRLIGRVKNKSSFIYV
jgi:group I intron endonuclease